MGKEKRILVVNNQEAVLYFLKDSLEYFGFGVSLANIIKEGLSFLKEQGMQGLLLDYEMAGKEGMIMVGTVRQLFPDLPVIMISADPTQTAMRKAIKAGARNFLLKPIPPVILQYKCLRFFY